MRVSVVVALARLQEIVELDVPAGSTIADALAAADIARRYAGVDRGTWRVGVWGVEKRVDTPLREGDRVEIYRGLQADAKQMRRARAKLRSAPRSRSGP